MTHAVFMFVQYRISMVFLIFYAISSMPLRFNHLRTGLVAGFLFAATAGIDAVMFFSPISTDQQALLNILEIPIALHCITILCRYQDMRGLFNAMTAAIFVLPGNIACSMVIIWTGSKLWALVVLLLVDTAFTLLTLKFLRNAYRESLEDANANWGWLCFLPAMFYSLTFTLTVWPSNIYSVRTNSLPLVFVIALIFCTYTILFRSFSQKQHELTLTRANDTLKLYTEHLVRESKRMKKSNADTAVMRHDMRHHMRIIDGYLEDGQIDKAQSAIAELGGVLDSLRPKRYCLNSAVNGIITQGSIMCEQAGINLTTKLDVPEFLKIPEFEFATVVSNLFENAIEGARGSRIPYPWVTINIHPAKNRIITEIINSCDVTLTGGSDFPQSTKEGPGHGLGHHSVMAFVSRYNAIFDYSVKDGIFTVRLLI